MFQRLMEYSLNYSVHDDVIYFLRSCILPFNLVSRYSTKFSTLNFIHMPQCPFRPFLHFTSICMSKPAESLKGSQPQQHSLSSKCLPEAAEAPSAPGDRESESLYMSPMGTGKSSFSNLVENASAHWGTITHSWDNKYQRETHKPPAN